MDMSEDRYAHIVVAARDAWGTFLCLPIFLPSLTYFLQIGHEKPACSLICKIIRKKNTYVTFIVSAAHYEKILNDISLRFEPGIEDALKAMIR